ncbi:unnamed protein product [Durusdinium trenchii]|uniref:Pectin acetylesterase n=1 Tax=Durusdinium trenchii TaxID=1381693 RepID=A0ABP0N2X9_9DINO
MTSLQRVDLRRAKCNDGSFGAFWFASGRGDRTVWHIHLQGGGYCHDEESCFSSRHSQKLMSSNHWPMRIQKGGLFSAGTPGLDEAAHAFIGYCSSDSWLGNSSQLWRGRAFYFQGSEILVETVETLLNFGMKHAKLVLFSGCSAGGRGLLYNLDGLCHLVRQSVSRSARCLGLADSAWWLDSVTTAKGLVWQSWLRHVAAKGGDAWGSSYLSQPLWRCRQAQQVRRAAGPTDHAKRAGLAQLSPNISRFDSCLFGPFLAEHLQTPVLAAVSLNDWFQFDHLAKSYHSIFLTSGPDGGPASRQDLEVIAALRSGFRETLAQWVDAAEDASRTVFASGCFGHCITEDAQYFNIRLREGPGQGMSLNDTTAAFLSGAMNSKAFIEQCHCSTLSCSDGCAPRKLWKVMLKGLAEYVLLPLLLLCVLRRLCCSRRSVEPLLGAPGSVS